MKSRSTRLRTTALAGLVVLTANVASFADAPAPTQSQAQFEVRFMTEMIDHHAMAIEMSEICLTNAVHHELIAMCQQIISAQAEEIATMQVWLPQWYGVSHEPRMTEGMEQQLARMSQLFGAEFEIKFMKSMIRHHWKAVVRATGCIDRAYHPDLVDMCAGIVETQVAEITQLRTWLCQWYSICNYGPKGAVGETQ